jgi:hypothetical protein
MRVASSVQFLLWPLLAGFSLGQTTTEAPLLTEQDMLDLMAEVDADYGLTDPPCNLTDWSPLGACSETCGTGTAEKTRTIIGDTNCSHAGLTAHDDCNTQSCPEDCRVTGFTDWTACSKTCGGGIRNRNRTLLTPASGGGKFCPGLSQTGIILLVNSILFTLFYSSSCLL